MRFYRSQLSEVITKILQGDIRGLLLYGPDKGYISKICQTIIHRGNFYKTVIDFKELSSSNLQSILNTPNFFNQKEFFKILDIGNNLPSDFQSVLKSECIHFPAFIADDPPAQSTIRKFFENSSNLASIGCYNDEERDIISLVKNKLEKAGKKIDPVALRLLGQTLVGDHRQVINELDKLLLFVHDETIIGEIDVKQVICQDISGNSDELCIYFCKNLPALFLQELEKILLQGINPVLVLRALSRYYLNLYYVACKVRTGDNLSNAIKSLSPPIFFKYVADFTEIVKGVELDNILKALYIIQEAEATYKKQPSNFDFFQQVFLPIHSHI